MTSQTAERLTTINRQDKASLIWAIADKLVGIYKPHEYGNYTSYVRHQAF